MTDYWDIWVLGVLFVLAGAFWYPIAIVCALLVGVGVGFMSYSLGQFVRHIWFK